MKNKVREIKDLSQLQLHSVTPMESEKIIAAKRASPPVSDKSKSQHNAELKKISKQPFGQMESREKYLERQVQRLNQEISEQESHLNRVILEVATAKESRDVVLAEKEQIILTVKKYQIRLSEILEETAHLKKRSDQLDFRELQIDKKESRVKQIEFFLEEKPGMEYVRLREENDRIKAQLALALADSDKHMKEFKMEVDNLNTALVSAVHENTELKQILIQQKRELNQTQTELKSRQKNSSKKEKLYDKAIKELVQLRTVKDNDNNLIRRLQENQKIYLSDIKTLKNHKSILSAQIVKLNENFEHTNNRGSRIASKSKSAIADTCQSAFAVNDLEILRQLSQVVMEVFNPPSKISLIGTGPFEEEEFDEYLSSLGVTKCSEGCNWIVVGRDGWIDSLDYLIEKQDSSDVRVFSQELFIAGQLTTHDPFSLPHKVLYKFAEGHPALEYLIANEFKWPEILVEELDVPDHVRGSFERVEKSPIYMLGYKVGSTNGVHIYKRQKILKEAFEGDIPYVEDADYMKEWGTPHTRKRLWRMAHHLAWLIRSRKSIDDMHTAVSHWTQDLDWLKSNFYRGSMRFKWPE